MSATQTTVPRVHVRAADYKRLGRALTVLAAYPWVFVASVYLDAFCLRLSLGRWPIPMTDGPSGFTGKLLDSVPCLLAWGMFLAVPAALPLTILGASQFRHRRGYAFRAALFAAGMVALVALICYDPAQVWRWFLD